MPFYLQCQLLSVARPQNSELGDVTTLNAIAEEIRAHSDSCVPLSKQIVQLAENFDLDGIQKLADALDAS
jgi:hypothetical protein